MATENAARNGVRLTMAQGALDRFVAEENSKAYENEPLEDQVVDLVTNLLHLAKSRGVDPQAVLDRAEMHYEAEIGDDEEGADDD
jgi:hypothetical protein